MVAGGHNRLRLRHGKTGSFDIVRQHCARGSHYIWMLQEKALGDFQVLRVGIEVIVEKEQDIVVAGQGEDCISLPGKPSFGLGKGHVRENDGGIGYVGRLRIGYKDLVRLPCLFGQKGDGFGEDRGATVRSDANNQPGSGFHGVQISR